LIQDKFNESYLRLAEQVNWFNQGVMEVVRQVQRLFMQTGSSAADSQGAAFSTVSGLLLRQANIDAMNHAIAVISGAILPAILLVLMMKDKRPSKNRKELAHEPTAEPVAVVD
jgi:hypothetical protein